MELCKTLGISLSSVAMYFTGHHKIRKVVALAIQASYGINAEWILAGKKPIFVKQASGKLPNDAMEVAIIYSNLPQKFRVMAKTILVALQNSRDN